MSCLRVLNLKGSFTACRVLRVLRRFRVWTEGFEIGFRVPLGSLDSPGFGIATGGGLRV